MSTWTEGGTLTHKSGTLRYTLHKKANETLEKGGIEAAVVCPEDVDPNEWIAVHAIDFYNDVVLIYSVVEDECTTYSCPVMSAGKNYEFLWTDKFKYRKPTRLPARTYIELLMNWVVRLLQDDSLFPIEPNVPFPRDYFTKVTSIFRRMLRVYEHIYYSHISLIYRLNLGDQFKFSLCHFLYFADQFYLIDPQDLRPLRELLNQLAPDLRLTKEVNAMQKGIDYYYYPSQTTPNQQNNPVFSDKSSQPHNKYFYVNNGQNSPSTLSTPNTLGENSSGQEADVDALAYDVDDLASRDEAMQQEFEDDARCDCTIY